MSSYFCCFHFWFTESIFCGLRVLRDQSGVTFCEPVCRFHSRAPPLLAGSVGRVSPAGSGQGTHACVCLTPHALVRQTAYRSLMGGGALHDSLGCFGHRVCC